MSPVYYSGDRH